jgi:hypothetical protein
MDINTIHNWVLLRAFMLFAMVAAFMAFAGIVVWYKAWRESGRRKDAREGSSSMSKQVAGNSTESIA